MGDTILREAMERYVPYEGISKLTRLAYVARAYEFRGRAEALFQAECMRQMAHTFVTKKQAQLIEIVRAKHVTFGRNNNTRGMYTYMYLPGTRTPDVRTGSIIVSADLVDRGCPVKQLLNLLRHEISHAATPCNGHDPVCREYNIAIGGDGETCDASSVTAGIIGHKVEIYCPVGGFETKGTNGHFFQTAQNKPTARKLQKLCLKCQRDGKSSFHKWHRVSVLETSDAFNGRKQSFVVHPTIKLLDAHPERGFLSTFRDSEYIPPPPSSQTVVVMEEEAVARTCDLCGEEQTESPEVCQVCRMLY